MQRSCNCSKSPEKTLQIGADVNWAAAVENVGLEEIVMETTGKWRVLPPTAAVPVPTTGGGGWAQTPLPPWRRLREHLWKAGRGWRFAVPPCASWSWRQSSNACPAPAPAIRLILPGWTLNPAGALEHGSVVCWQVPRAPWKNSSQLSWEVFLGMKPMFFSSTQGEWVEVLGLFSLSSLLQYSVWRVGGFSRQGGLKTHSLTHTLSSLHTLLLKDANANKCFLRVGPCSVSVCSLAVAVIVFLKIY